MKKLFALALIVCLLVSVSALAETTFRFEIDGLKDLTFKELVAAKQALIQQIDQMIMNHEDWQAVEVPQGVWCVGEDIPAGKWTVKCAEPWRYTDISWGTDLREDGESISWTSSRYSAINYIYNANHARYKKDDGITEYTFEAKTGEYIVVDGGSAIFSPYIGKPSLGFK